MARRSAELHLDDSVFSRYVSWLKGASGCLYGNCDLNQNWHTHEAVTALLSGAVLTTIKLVGAATVVAIVLGVFVGIISALRQYTGFDYSITFLSFLMYSLPVFWVAVLAKVFLAIRFNDFLAAPSPALSAGFIAILAAITALAVAAAVAGNWRIRLRNFAIVAAGVVVLCLYANLTNFFKDPQVGIVLIILISVGWAVVITELSTGLRNKKALYSALSVAALGAVLYLPMLYFWQWAERLRVPRLARRAADVRDRPRRQRGRSASPGVGPTAPARRARRH